MGCHINHLVYPEIKIKKHFDGIPKGIVDVVKCQGSRIDKIFPLFIFSLTINSSYTIKSYGSDLDPTYSCVTSLTCRRGVFGAFVWLYIHGTLLRQGPHVTVFTKRFCSLLRTISRFN